MKERLLNYLKWFFIILGVLFLVQLILISGIVISFNTMKEPDFKPIKIKQPDIKTKEIQPVIDYAEKFYNENKTYPDKVVIKIKNGDYSYKTTNNANCFEIEYNHKKSQKKYGKCSTNKDGLSSVSESFSEIQK